MREAIYLIATIVLVPYATLASGFALLWHATAEGTLAGIFRALVAVAGVLFPWGSIAILILLIAIFALGASARRRWLGSALLFVLTGASLATIALLTDASADVGGLLFLLPGAASAAALAWLIAADLRSAASARMP